ncbi:MAG TPA: hypothetical protein VGR16_03895 [Thermomicrobiales bacterium]|nr:hypothetical protein [Thermomicrobiales bacterium]
MHAAHQRNQAGTSWIAKAVVFALAATLASVLAGWVLGFAGEAISFNARVAVASLLAVIAIGIGALELGPRPPRLLQWDGETPQRWMNAGALRWASLNGAALGIGATSRIGFWLWYAIPCSAFLLGDPLLGALLYGIYGCVRGWSVWAFLLLPRRLGIGGDAFGVWLVTHGEWSRLVAATQLLAMGIAVAIAIGL